LYFGIDKENPQSIELHHLFKEIGYNLQWKEVKWVPVDLRVIHYKDETGKIRKFFETAEGKKIYEKLNKIKEIIKNLQIYRRKCDFDVEITLDVLRNIDKMDSVILFSGEGDYAALINEVIKRGKQAIVVALKGAMGKEYTVIPKGLYICNVKKFKKFIQK